MCRRSASAGPSASSSHVPPAHTFEFVPGLFPVWRISPLPAQLSSAQLSCARACLLAAAPPRLWASEGGHTETIFDCQFCPTRPLVMATASYDATVRLWHTDNTACSITLTVRPTRGIQCLRNRPPSAPSHVSTSPPLPPLPHPHPHPPLPAQGASGPLYSVCWSPDGARLAASGVHGEVFLYDLTRASVVCICRHHSKAVYRVDWSHVDPDLLASASGDSTCVLFRSSGVVVAALTHPAPCFGCAFSPPGAQPRTRFFLEAPRWPC